MQHDRDKTKEGNDVIPTAHEIIHNMECPGGLRERVRDQISRPKIQSFLYGAYQPINVSIHLTPKAEVQGVLDELEAAGFDCSVYGCHTLRIRIKTEILDAHHGRVPHQH